MNNDECVPDWAKDVIWYQIFPERFRNGCPGSTPKQTDFSDHTIEQWKPSSWGMDWYSQEPWEKKMGNYFSSVFSRRFGGDLVGVREKLDYLQELGITAIYLNPIFQARSLHKYDATNYHHIDPAFGPDREGDLNMIAHAHETNDPTTWVWTAADEYFTQLVKEIHHRGMRVIIDGVFNHTGKAFFAFDDIVKNGRHSRYRLWYKILKWHDHKHFDYTGWFGVKELPELGRIGGNLRRPIREYIHAITRRWMDPHGDGDLSYGVDGWRLDVAFCVPHAFWKEWRTVVRGINPEAYLTGELVGLAMDYLRGDEFDAVMNYMWAYPVLSFFIRGKTSISASACKAAIQDVLDSYPEEVNEVMQNLLDSHDTGRVLTMIANPDRSKNGWDDYFGQFRVWDHRSINTRKPDSDAVQVLKQVVLMQMTFVGAPMIYYGTEVGLWGANDPADRQPMLWDDIEYDQVEQDVKGHKRAVIRQPDKKLFAFYQQAIGLRKEHVVLRRGAVRWLDTENEEVLGFVRFHADEQIAVLFNVGDTPCDVTLPFEGHDLWEGVNITTKAHTIGAKEWCIVRFACSPAKKRTAQ